jgi:CarD family transcriptional regulator
VYPEIVNTGNRMDIAKVANTLLRKKQELESEGRKFFVQDSRLLTTIQNILFKELAIALNTSSEAISEKVNNMLIRNGLITYSR